MELVEDRPPPLPPKTKRLILGGESEDKSKLINYTGLSQYAAAPESGSKKTSSKVTGTFEESNFSGSCSWIPVSRKADDDYENKNGISTWIDQKSQVKCADIYEKEKYALTVKSDEKSERKRNTSKIEVRQEDNKTVVKILIKETLTPEEEGSAEKRPEVNDENIFKNDTRKTDKSLSSKFGTDNGEEASHRRNDTIYENVIVSGENELEERFYENLVHQVNSREAKCEKEKMAEVNYANVNGSDFRYNPGYDDEFYFPRKPEEYEKGHELYENVEKNTSAYSKNDRCEKDEKTTIKIGLSGSTRSQPETFQKDQADSKDSRAEEEHLFRDSFDSGTSSDVESLPTFVQTKKGNVIVAIRSLQGEEVKRAEMGHRRAESLTSSGVGVDSEESEDEKSNISCDSLNSNEPYPQSNSEDHGYHTPNFEDKSSSPIERLDYENIVPEAIIERISDKKQKIDEFCSGDKATDFEDYQNTRATVKKPLPSVPRSEGLGKGKIEKTSQKSLPKNLLHDIRSRTVRLSTTYPNGESRERIKPLVNETILNLESKLPQGDVEANKPTIHEKDNKRDLMIEEKTYEERKINVRSIKVNRICAMEIDTDKFYKFHLSENFREDNWASDETFAGIKDYLSREKPAAITSAKGTIRGVKNRVKAGIATFLHLHENKTYKDRDSGKVVVYTTTMGIVRETYQKCLKVKQILKTLMIKFEERDVFMSSEVQDEIRDRMKCDVILVPQVFVEGQHIGDAETIERLNEMGELRTILKPYKSLDACTTCKVCGGYRLLPCNICKGSKKSIHRNHFTAEFVSLKCVNCDQVGLTKCHAC